MESNSANNGWEPFGPRFPTYIMGAGGSPTAAKASCLFRLIPRPTAPSTCQPRSARQAAPSAPAPSAQPAQAGPGGQRPQGVLLRHGSPGRV